LQIQALTNKTAADQATLAYASWADQQQQDYHNNNPGLAAGQNLPDFHTHIQDGRTQFSANLSPAATAEFESASRRYAATVLQNTANFANTQRITATESTAKATIALAATKYAQTPDDPLAADNFHAAVGQQVAVLGTLHPPWRVAEMGWDSPQGHK